MKILIADDEETVLQLLDSLLTKWGFETVLCGNGKDAWEIIQQEDAPDILLLDWIMPDMNGVELCRKVRELKKEPSPYIMILTAKDKKEDIIEGIESGADNYITKPFFPHELKVRIQAGQRMVELQQELLRTRDQLQIEATHDSLTGILNRRAIFESLETEIGRSHRSGKTLSIVMIDIDHFKQVNDTYGHQAGDQVLRLVTEKIKKDIRPYDSIGRYGGEEFMMILPECHVDMAFKTVDRIRIDVENLYLDTPQGKLSVTISAGIRQIPIGELRDSDTAVKAADKALYRAKNNGRNRVEIADDE